MKTDKIIIRVTKSMKLAIKQLAKLENKSISDFTRDSIIQSVSTNK